MFVKIKVPPRIRRNAILFTLAGVLALITRVIWDILHNFNFMERMKERSLI